MVKPAAMFQDIGMDRSDASPSSSALARTLLAAPHRMLFLIGALNVLAAMVWWTLWLFEVRWGWPPLPDAPHYAGWLHAIVMQYQVLPPFIFGFLLTVFPRWMNQPELRRRHYAPVALGLLGGQAATLLGAACGVMAALWLGAALTLFGWALGCFWLLRLLARDRLRNRHALSCAAGVAMGVIGLACYAIFLATLDARWMQGSIKLGGFGVLLPIYATVAHRMFPFFAGNVVRGYYAWRPMPWLAALWALALLHLGLDLAGWREWLWLADLPLLALSAHWLWRNGVWRRGPPLLRVLFIGYVWLPVSMALFAAQSLWLLASGDWLLGRAPAHALFVGFFGSVLVAMVTRVTQGHSGRPLQLGGVAAFAFVTIQLVSVTRILAECLSDPMRWQALSALGWLVAFLPWVARSAWIYCRPRADGKPG